MTRPRMWRCYVSIRVELLLSRTVRAETVIRVGDQGDVMGIAAVHLATRRTAYRHLLDGDMLAAMTREEVELWWRERLRCVPQPHRLLVAVTDAVVGFAHVGPGNEPGIGEIYAIHVHPRAQHAGVGGRLLAGGIQALREFGHRRARLWVLEGNHAARAFYAHHGWQAAEHLRRTDAIGAGVVTEVAYERDLEPVAK